YQLQDPTLGAWDQPHLSYARARLQQARDQLRRLVAEMATSARPVGVTGVWEPETRANQAAGRLCERLSPALLLVPDQSLFWDSVLNQVVVPLYSISPAATMAAKRSWARLQATLTGPDLLSQLQQAFATLPEFEWAVQDMTSKLSEASDRQGMVALMQGQQAQIQQLASGSRQQQAPAARMAAAWT
ncbi:hypothetical protein MNEG_2438, partial [Monoraphidium neglectum]